MTATFTLCILFTDFYFASRESNKLVSYTVIVQNNYKIIAFHFQSKFATAVKTLLFKKIIHYRGASRKSHQKTAVVIHKSNLKWSIFNNVSSYESFYEVSLRCREKHALRIKHTKLTQDYLSPILIKDTLWLTIFC